MNLHLVIQYTIQYLGRYLSSMERSSQSYRLQVQCTSIILYYIGAQILFDLSCTYPLLQLSFMWWCNTTTTTTVLYRLQGRIFAQFNQVVHKRSEISSDFPHRYTQGGYISTFIDVYLGLHMQLEAFIGQIFFAFYIVSSIFLILQVYVVLI